MTGTRTYFRPMTAPTGITAIGATADSIAVNGRDITFINVSGNIWINPVATAVANATALKLVAGDSIDMNVRSSLSIISDGDGGTYQIIYWD